MPFDASPPPTPLAPSPTLPEPPPEPAPKPRGPLRDLVEMALIVVVIFFGVRMFMQPYQVEGASMTPYLANGERVFVNRAAYAHLDLTALWHALPGDAHPFSKPQRGDIIVLESDQTTQDDQYIKRIVGLPGETVTFSEGLVFIDGQPLVEDYIDGAITECRQFQYCTVTVPDGYVFVLGDNRTNSEDSRVFGPIPQGDIVGKAIFSNWPFDKFGPIHHPDYGEPAS